MKIRYVCECCGALISELDMEKVDEERLGFSCLTSEEREDIIKYDEKAGVITVSSLCDDCIDPEDMEGYIH